MARSELSDSRPWRLLRRLLPAWFAERYADDLLETHIDRARASGASRWSFWADVAGDVILTAFQLRFDRSSSHHPAGRIARPGAVMRQTMFYAWRSLSHAKGFSTAVVLALALGIAATATLFTVTDRLLLSAPDYIERPDELRRVLVHGISSFKREKVFSAALSYPDYVDLARVESFRQLAGFSPAEMTIGDAGSTQRLRIELVTASYFPLLGVRPTLGRAFAPADDRIGADPVVVLSHGFWQRRFGSDSTALGRRLRIGKGTYTIVGVMPHGFTGAGANRVELWLPLLAAQAVQSGRQWEKARTWYWLAAIARVAPGVEDQAAAEATIAYRNGRRSVPRDDPEARVTLASIIGGRGPNASDEARIAPALAGLALMVLLLSCANVANLILARGIQRRRTLAIQTAIGLTRGRLIAHSLLEVALLATIGGVLALGLTRAATPILFGALLPDVAAPTGVSLRLAVFMLTAIVGTALIAGMIPALQSSRVDAFEALRFTRDTRRSGRLRHALLFAQASLCAILLVGAGMFVRSVQESQRIDIGVDRGTVMVQLELNDGSRFSDAVAEVSYTSLQRIRALPDVESAAVTSMPHFFGSWGITIWTRHDSIPSGARGPFYYGAGGDYFRTIGLSVLRGRALTDADDRPDAPRVVVLSQALARSAFPGQNPIGQCMYLQKRENECSQVVGVVEDALPSLRAAAPNFILYVPPHHADIGQVAAGTILVQPKNSAALNAIRAAALSGSPDIRVAEVRPMGTLLDGQTRSWKLGATLLSAFGILAVIVAIAGIYSSLTFDVAQRRFELGVRSALGASAAALVRASTARALVMCGGGAVVGLAVAAMLMKLAASLLFHVSPTEPAVYGAVLGLFLAAGCLAATLPAWRAVRADPRTALQSD